VTLLPRKMTEDEDGRSATVTTPEVRARGTRLPRTARRSQLLGAAREVFVAQGYHAAAMDEIAERAGVSKPVLYQHFPGKHELYLALVDQHATEIVDGVRNALEGTNDNRMRGLGAIAAFFDFIDGEGESFRLVFESDLTNDPQVAARVNWVHEQCAEAIAGIIHEETGLPPDQANLMGMALGGMAHVAARHWFKTGRRMPREDAIAIVAQLSWRGIAGYPRLHEDGEGDHDRRGAGPGRHPGRRRAAEPGRRHRGHRDPGRRHRGDRRRAQRTGRRRQVLTRPGGRALTRPGLSPAGGLVCARSEQGCARRPPGRPAGLACRSRPAPSRSPGTDRQRSAQIRRSPAVEVKIGIRDIARELVLESEQSPDTVAAAVEDAVTRGTMLRLIDDKGRLIVVPGAILGYVEIGAPETRRVGFGGS